MKKVNIPKAADRFIEDVAEIKCYLEECSRVFVERDLYLSNSYEYAIIALYKAFEKFIFKTIVGCVNHDNSAVTNTYGVQFGKHITDDICEFIITKGGYFDFKDREGLIKIIKQNVGEETYDVYSIVKKEQYASSLKQLCALRNYAAHTSKQAKKKAAKELGIIRIGTVGSCLKTQNRFSKIADDLTELATNIKDSCHS